jgi:hypothetical protein
LNNTNPSELKQRKREEKEKSAKGNNKPRRRFRSSSTFGFVRGLAEAKEMKPEPMKRSRRTELIVCYRSEFAKESKETNLILCRSGI